MARILRKMPAEALARVGNHNERGQLTLEQMLGNMTITSPSRQICRGEAESAGTAG